MSYIKKYFHQPNKSFTQFENNSNFIMETIILQYNKPFKHSYNAQSHKVTKFCAI